MRYAGSAASFTGRTRECALTCARSGYGIVTPDGTFLNFDEAGNVRTLSLLKKATKGRDLEAKVTGMIDGDSLNGRQRVFAVN